ncbi:MAG: type 3 dihydrofolate reductase [Gammaproteobacteria bacterium]|nr:MAG: type 3 dihydrofolate reductase [Gammaproteobacteria bacterium]
MKQKISIIVALATNHVIGKNNQIPWHIPKDLQYFKRITMGKPMIMGRKNFESIGRPLPGRKNIILTRDKDYKAEGCIITHSKEEAVAAADNAEEIMIIGGGAIYEMFLDEADMLYLTEIDSDVEGDVLFPKYDKTQWKEVSREAGEENLDWNYDYVVYNRK